HSELISADKDLPQMRQEVINGERCWPGEGISIHSANSEISLNGLNVESAKIAMTSWLEKKGYGKKAVNYKLRDWLFSRQRYWGEPFPILHFKDGTKRILDIDELPLCPPELDDFKPVGDGRSPLAKVKDWVDIVDPKTGKPATRETNTMPQWAGSCWYYLRFCDPQNDQQAWSPQAENYWLPVDMYVGGVEHAVLHLLYARFWHKVLYDCGVVSTPEPFKTLRNQGLIVSRSYKNSKNMYVPSDMVQEVSGRYTHRTNGEVLTSQIEKMSKSKLNGVVPDDIIEEFGADSLRLYEMFMGPLDKEKVWNTDAVSGCRRFLTRFYEMATSEKVSDKNTNEALKLGHRLVHSVAGDIESMQFNTAIAKMMEFINDFTKLEAYPRVVIQMVSQALMPFAPHLAEEVWELTGGEGRLSHLPYPKADEKYLHEETATYVIQVNGRVRARFELTKGLTENQILTYAKEDPNVSRFLEDKKIAKIIYVPDKLLNVVVE
ncbi:MAG TPA: class I tRNA ligase family protein, partial [Waddliaceae bacterium]